MNINIVLVPAEEGGFNFSVPALDGRFTQGDTEEESIDDGLIIHKHIPGL